MTMQSPKLTKENIPTPVYLVYEDRLRKNLSLIDRVKKESGVNIIMALKANALWRTFPIVREYCRDFTASSLNELALGMETLGGDAHSYCPAYTEDTIGDYIARSSHITFNSLSQLERFGKRTAEAGVSVGLRVNPQCSVIGTDFYNPALPGSRFGVPAEDMPDELPDYVDGLHFHALCESTSHDLEKVLIAFEEQFGRHSDRLKWINMGGGHLMTREGYDTEHLIRLLRDFRRSHPNLEVILEPGSAFTWRTGDLIASVVDIVVNQGVKTAIIDASFACHMPDCLEMPYKPAISESTDENEGSYIYRMGGNSCLSGDFYGEWHFKKPLERGERLTFEDMNHYTTVKTTMFNGIQHPDMALQRCNGDIEYLRRFTYEDYKSRMS